MFPLSKQFFYLLLALLMLGSLSAQDKPNIILIYIDDWGWSGTPFGMDSSMANAKMPALQMPNLESLAEGGMTFRNAYGSPQCSPARVCVQTGQSSPRNGFTVFLGSKDEYYDTRRENLKMPVIPNVSDMEIDPDAVTIPKALKPLGYVSAHIGKWHMRGDPAEAGYAVHDGDTTNSEGNTLTTGLPKGAPAPKRLPKDLEDPKLMFSVTRKALGFMDEQVKAETPFYLQISHYAMHEGPECLNATREKYVNHPLVQAYYKTHDKDPETLFRKDDPAIWLGMGEDLDGRIGAVLDKIKELGIQDNTYVLVAGDNGYRHHELLLDPDLTQPLHSRKWWLWEGGLRVPMIVNGPGIEAGAVFTGNVINYDFLPTFVDWAGGKPESIEGIDGVSLANYMEGATPDDAFLNRNLYFHYPHYRSSMPHSAIISGSHKVMHFYEKPDIAMLFDLSTDLGEVKNIAKQNPETHQQLFGEMMDYLQNVEARIPKENPDYDPEFYQGQKDYDVRKMWGPFEGERPLEEDEI